MAGGTTQKQVHQYDKIFRENMEATLPLIIRNLLHIHVQSYEVLPDGLHHTKERNTDLLRRVTDSSGNSFILHIEYQAGNKPQMALRMAEYCIMALRQYKLPVRQYVIFLGKGKAAMPATINEDNLKFHYTLLSMNQVDYRIFLRSDTPEEKILAILGNFEGESPELVARDICRELNRCVPNALDAGRYFRQLRILAQLRNLNLNFLKDMESIASFFSEEKDVFYIKGKKEGKKEGIEKGKKEGIQKGLEKGMQQERINIAIELKKEGLPAAYIARITKLTVEIVEKL